MAAIADPRVFGYVTEAHALLEVNPEHEEAAVKSILEMPEVSYVAYGQGPRDLWIRARFKDNAEMRDFIRLTLPSLEGVSVVSHNLVPRVLREASDWMPRPEDFESGQEKSAV
jgi:DNA-binding Lrp family transcriptional regulator